MERNNYLGKVLQLRVHHQHVRGVFMKHTLQIFTRVEWHFSVRGIERIKALLFDHVTQQSCNAIRVLSSARSQLYRCHVPQHIRRGDADAHSIHAEHCGVRDQLDVRGLWLGLFMNHSVSTEVVMTRVTYRVAGLRIHEGLMGIAQ